MPGHIKAKKDAANGETRRGVVSRQRTGDIRMGEPIHQEGCISTASAVGGKTQGTETSKYLKEKKVKTIF